MALIINLPIEATTLRELSLDELVGYADVIVVGKCEKVEAVWLEKKIYTIATVQIIHAAKGDQSAGRRIEVHTLGGSLKEPIPVKMHVPGAESIAAGEEVLLFLEKFGDQKQFHRVVGMAQGKLAVFDDPKTKEKAVSFPQPIKGVKWVGRNGRAVPAGALDAQEEPAPSGSLEGFVGRIHKIKVEQETKVKAERDTQSKKGDGK
jgi:hypothetical protein